MHSMTHSKLELECFTILFNGAYFLLAVMVKGDESSRLRMTIKLAVCFGQLNRPLLTVFPLGV